MNNRTFQASLALAGFCAIGLSSSPSAANHAGREAAPIRGIVRDNVRHAPLAAYALDVHGGASDERVTTDASGHFVTAIPFDAGHITIVPVDDAATMRGVRIGGWAMPAPALAAIERTWSPNSGDVEIEVEVGPTFELAFHAAEATSQDAPCAPKTLDGLRAYIEAVATESIDEGPTLSAFVHMTSAAPWLRFAPIPSTYFARPKHVRLVVLSRDGLWRAEADVTELLADPVAPIVLTWKACARWSGRIRSSHGDPEPNVWLTMTRIGASGQALERRRTRADLRGEYAFDALTPGDWQLSGRPLRFAEFSSMTRTLAGRADSKLNVNLEKVPLAGNLSGRIEGPSSKSPQPLAATVVLRRGGEALPAESVTALWRIDGDHWIGEFGFPSLPGGEYTLELATGTDGDSPFVSRILSVNVPSTSAVFQRKSS